MLVSVDMCVGRMRTTKKGKKKEEFETIDGVYESYDAHAFMTWMEDWKERLLAEEDVFFADCDIGRMAPHLVGPDVGVNPFGAEPGKRDVAAIVVTYWCDQLYSASENREGVLAMQSDMDADLAKLRAKAQEIPHILIEGEAFALLEFKHLNSLAGPVHVTAVDWYTDGLEESDTVPYPFPIANDSSPYYDKEVYVTHHTTEAAGPDTKSWVKRLWTTAVGEGKIRTPGIHPFAS